MSQAASTTVSVNLGERSYDILIADGLLPAAAGHVAPWVERLGRKGSGRRSSLPTGTWRATPTGSGRVSTPPDGRPRALSSRRGKIRSGWKSSVTAMTGWSNCGRTAGRSCSRSAAASSATSPGSSRRPTTAGCRSSSAQRRCWRTSTVRSAARRGVNHPQAKNLIGAFHQPLGVLIDTAVLETLPDREYRAGLAEVVKYGVILDAEFFDWLEGAHRRAQRAEPAAAQYAIARSCRLKADVVEQDEYERTGLRAVLNYGHTFAHAFEAIAEYGELLHGEAVSIGMLYASRLAEQLGRIDAAATARQVFSPERAETPGFAPGGDVAGRGADRPDAAGQEVRVGAAAVRPADADRPRRPGRRGGRASGPRTSDEFARLKRRGNGEVRQNVPPDGPKGELGLLAGDWSLRREYAGLYSWGPEFPVGTGFGGRSPDVSASGERYAPPSACGIAIDRDFSRAGCCAVGTDSSPNAPKPIYPIGSASPRPREARMILAAPRSPTAAVARR